MTFIILYICVVLNVFPMGMDGQCGVSLVYG